VEATTANTNSANTLLLFLLQGYGPAMSFGDIADTLKISRAALHQRCFRADIEGRSYLPAEGRLDRSHWATASIARWMDAPSRTVEAVAPEHTFASPAQRGPGRPRKKPRGGASREGA